MASALLVTRQNEVEVGGLVDGIEHGEDGAAWVSEDLLDAMAQHHLVEDLATRKTDEGMVQRCIGCKSGSVDVRWGQPGVARSGDLLEARSRRGPSAQE